MSKEKAKMEPVAAPAKDAAPDGFVTAEALAGTPVADAEQAPADTEQVPVGAALRADEPVSLKAYGGGYVELPAMVDSPTALNLREGPGKEFLVLAVLPDGASVTVCPLPYDAEVPGWALIVSELDTMGWVMTDFLSEPPGEA